MQKSFYDTQHYIHTCDVFVCFKSGKLLIDELVWKLTFVFIDNTSLKININWNIHSCYNSNYIENDITKLW